VQRRVEIVGLPPEVIDADHPERGGAGPQWVMGIAQHADALGSKRARDLIGVDLKIVISQHRENSQARAEHSERLRQRPDIIAREGDVISREGHKVGPQAVGQVYGALNFLKGRKEAVMQVGELDDPQPVVRRAEPP
jgi:hypothetical protein